LAERKTARLPNLLHPGGDQHARTLRGHARMHRTPLKQRLIVTIVLIFPIVRLSLSA